MTHRTRRLLPVLAGVALALTMAWVQFMVPLGNMSIFANLGLAVGFYFCYAWYERIVASEKSAQSGPETGTR